MRAEKVSFNARALVPLQFRTIIDESTRCDNETDLHYSDPEDEFTYEKLQTVGLL